MNILLSITFVFGVLRLLTLTKLFDNFLQNLDKTLFGKKSGDAFVFLGNVFFYFSLCFQAWFWVFNK